MVEKDLGSLGCQGLQAFGTMYREKPGLCWDGKATVQRNLRNRKNCNLLQLLHQDQLGKLTYQVQPHLIQVELDAVMRTKDHADRLLIKKTMFVRQILFKQFLKELRLRQTVPTDMIL